MIKFKNEKEEEMWFEVWKVVANNSENIASPTKWADSFLNEFRMRKNNEEML